jgi:hypothetical protein
MKGGCFKLSVMFNPKCDKPADILSFLKAKQQEIEKLLADLNSTGGADTSTGEPAQSPVSGN